MNNTDFDIIFKNVNFLDSIGLFYCLFALKQNLDIPAYTNIVKELKKLSSSPSPSFTDNNIGEVKVLRNPDHAIEPTEHPEIQTE